MFEFKYWSDIFQEHYIFSILISFIIIFVTLFITKVYDVKNIIKSTPDSVCYEDSSSEVIFKENMSETVQSMTAPSLKKYPALVAEKVIEANMTDEQRQREHEVRQKQLSQIYELMQKQTEKFGDISLSEIEEQFKLYQ